MDYDKTQMPASYDAGRSYSPEVMALALDALACHVPPAAVRNIVDLGCGTVRFSSALAERYEAALIGVDPSEKMLAQARAKQTGGRVSFRFGRGEDLPIETASADMVFISMVFHHFTDPAAVARECRRVLGPGGTVCLRNSTREHRETYPNRIFFPCIDDVLDRRLPSRASITTPFEAAGFALSALQVVSHEVAPNWAKFAAKTACRADSFLTELSDENFATGMTRLRRHAERADPAEAIFIDIDLLVFRPRPGAEITTA